MYVVSFEKKTIFRLEPYVLMFVACMMDCYSEVKGYLSLI